MSMISSCYEEDWGAAGKSKSKSKSKKGMSLSKKMKSKSFGKKKKSSSMWGMSMISSCYEQELTLSVKSCTNTFAAGGPVSADLMEGLMEMDTTDDGACCGGDKEMGLPAPAMAMGIDSVDECEDDTAALLEELEAMVAGEGEAG